MRTIIKLFINVCFAVLATTAFANGEYGASGLNMNDARRVGQVQRGVVLDIRPVKITVDSGIGAKAAGASVGAAVGGMVCKNQNWQVAMLCGSIGGVVGGVAGDAVGTSRRDGVEMIVAIDKTGELVTVAQELQGTQIPASGSKVFIATINGQTRVFPDLTSSTTTQPAPAVRRSRM